MLRYTRLHKAKILLHDNTCSNEKTFDLHHQRSPSKQDAKKLKKLNKAAHYKTNYGCHRWVLKTMKLSNDVNQWAFSSSYVTMAIIDSLKKI